MPDIGFSEDNKRSSVYDMKRFKLDANERARISVLDEKAKMEYVHYVKAPSTDGKQFGTYYFCLGREDVLKAEHSDSERCPFCRMAERPGGGPVEALKRRFAIHIARYRTNQRGDVPKVPKKDPKDPDKFVVQLGLEVWVFSDGMYNKLVERAIEWQDLRKIDLTVKCVSAQYQNLDLEVGKELIWAQDEMSKAEYRAIREQRSPDINRLLGKMVSYDQAEKLLGTESRGTSSSDIDALNSRLDASTAAPVAAAAFDDLFGGTLGSTTSVSVEDAPEVQGEELDFADLLR